MVCRHEDPDADASIAERRHAEMSDAAPSARRGAASARRRLEVTMHEYELGAPEHVRRREDQAREQARPVATPPTRPGR